MPPLAVPPSLSSLPTPQLSALANPTDPINFRTHRSSTVHHTTKTESLLPAITQRHNKQKKGSRRESNPGPLAIGLEFSRIA
ncbi:hypothetical protein AUEXF2481DRAFT_43960 [Aureobasidium subglaciale EXF-2481]|uniref:Uncharacterized protein n=1 Tax=Aureobasidium subglaciale (strain EXF-2481) TaxID=1043005 RepID=A0A074Y6L0_AURSE|nr:uncharacterized protein AUEXF2481DRAFT_43960 [Aureobasidium subglaciale EXF-2481]KEQ91584.1 hypothetical protein AUEXF2481DRAFT_43960 [Aureobasidium subglaciale EXF-2481]